MIPKGSRRLTAFMWAAALIVVPDSVAGLGMSMHAASAMAVLTGAHFAGVAWAKGKAADNGHGEDKPDG